MNFKVTHIKACAVSILALSAVSAAAPVQARMVCDTEKDLSANACMSDVINEIITSKTPETVKPLKNADGFVLSLDGHAVTADEAFKAQADSVKDASEMAVTQARVTPTAAPLQTPAAEEIATPAPAEWFYFATADLT